MAYLKDLSVSKISFVQKPANKRKFILLKSGDEDQNQHNADDNNNQGDIVKMRKEIKDKLIEVMKSEKSPDKIKEALKSDTNLKLTEAEIGEVGDFLDIIPVPPVTPPEPVKKDDKEDTEKAALLKANQDLMARLSVIEKAQERRDLVSWLQKECPYLPDDVEKAADVIMELAAVSKEAANKYKETLQKTSVTVANSKLFSESGVSTDKLLASEGNELDLVRKVAKDFDTIKKSDKPLNAQTIRNIVNNYGGDYDIYREKHILRAKLNV